MCVNNENDLKYNADNCQQNSHEIGLYMFRIGKIMFQFLTDQRFFVVSVTKLGVFLQKIPQSNINTIYQNDLHFMFCPTV